MRHSALFAGSKTNIIERFCKKSVDSRSKILKMHFRCHALQHAAKSKQKRKAQRFVVL